MSSSLYSSTNLNDVTSKINEIVNEIHLYSTVNFTTGQMIKCDKLIKDAGYKFCVSDLENTNGTITEDWFELFENVVAEAKISLVA